MMSILAGLFAVEIGIFVVFCGILLFEIIFEELDVQDMGTISYILLQDVLAGVSSFILYMLSEDKIIFKDSVFGISLIVSLVIVSIVFVLYFYYNREFIKEWRIDRKLQEIKSKMSQLEDSEKKIKKDSSIGKAEKEQLLTCIAKAKETLKREKMAIKLNDTMKMLKDTTDDKVIDIQKELDVMEAMSKL